MSAGRFSRVGAFVVACTLSGACGSGTAKPDAAAPKAAQGGGEQSGAADAGKYATAPKDPCEWIPAAEVERSVGPLVGTPTRVRSAESSNPDPRGSGCLYTLAQQATLGKGTVTVEVVLNQGVVEQDAIGKMRDRLARELNDGAAPETKAEPSTASTGPWDSAVRLPNMFMGRQGTMGVRVGTEALDIRTEALGALAASVLDRLPDRPFSLPPNPDLEELAKLNPDVLKAPRPSTSTDPCTLLTRQEAEAVLGPLSAAPYRSAQDSALASPDGKSCSYYTTRHRALIITPEWAGGRVLFGMVKGVSGLAGSVLGAPEGAPGATGPWEKVAGDTTGALNFLKGDRMLTMQYRMSGAEKDGALRLAAQAVNRL